MAGKGSTFLETLFEVGFLVPQLLKAHRIFYVISSDTKSKTRLKRPQCPASLVWFSPTGLSWSQTNWYLSFPLKVGSHMTESYSHTFNCSGRKLNMITTDPAAITQHSCRGKSDLPGLFSPLCSSLNCSLSLALLVWERSFPTAFSLTHFRSSSQHSENAWNVKDISCPMHGLNAYLFVQVQGTEVSHARTYFSEYNLKSQSCFVR